MKTGHFFLLSLFFVFELSAQNTAEFGYDVMKLDKKWIFSQDSSISPMPMSDSVPRPRLADLKFNTGLNFDKPLFKSEIINLKVPKFVPNFDYSVNTYSLIPINSNSWITTSRINSNYIGMGGLSSAGAQYNWRINDFMFYSGGAAFSKFNIYNNFSNNLSLNSNLRFELSDRFFFNVFGNYTTPSEPQMNLFLSTYDSMFPQKNFGGSFEFKVTDKWGIVTGAEREFDPFKGKWVTKPFIMPIFYSK
jgi:hypothetical protein